MSNDLRTTATITTRTQEQQEKRDEKTTNAMSNAPTKAAADKTTRFQPSFAMAMEAFGMGWPSSK